MEQEQFRRPCCRSLCNARCEAVPQEERCTSNYLLRRSATSLCLAIATHPPGISGHLAPRPRRCPHQTAWNGSMRNRSMPDHRVRAHGKQKATPEVRKLHAAVQCGHLACADCLTEANPSIHITEPAQPRQIAKNTTEPTSTLMSLKEKLHQ